MIIIGELINAARKAVKDAVESKDGEAIQTLASKANADYIDVNAGIFVDDEADFAS